MTSSRLLLVASCFLCASHSQVFPRIVTGNSMRKEALLATLRQARHSTLRNETVHVGSKNFSAGTGTGIKEGTQVDTGDVGRSGGNTAGRMDHPNTSSVNIPATSETAPTEYVAAHSSWENLILDGPRLWQYSTPPRNASLRRREPFEKIDCLDSGFDISITCSIIQGTCGFGALNKYKMEACVPNQCKPPCKRMDLIQRNPQLRTACHLPTFCRQDRKDGGNSKTLKVPGLPKDVAFCGMDDAGSGGGRMEKANKTLARIADKVATPSERTYERAFWLHGFGGNTGRCEWYHSFDEVQRAFQLVMEEFQVDLDNVIETFPSRERVALIAEQGLADVLRDRCTAMRTLLEAFGTLDMNKGGCFRDGVVGLSNTAWVSGSYPLPWQPVTTNQVKYLRAFRSVMLNRVLNLNGTAVRNIDGAVATAALCDGTRKPRMLIMDRGESGHNRLLVGRERLVNAAKAIGFDVIAQDPKGNVTEQMKFIAGFDVLFGRHGAGLTWSSMLPSYGVVVEMVAKGSGHKKEYFNQWDNRDPHYYLFTNWATSTGLAYMTWVAEETASQDVIRKAKDEDWKSGPFQVTDRQARQYAEGAMGALRAGASCEGAEMPPGVAHWRNNTRTDALFPVVKPGGALAAGNPAYAMCDGGYLKGGDRRACHDLAAPYF